MMRMPGCPASPQATCVLVMRTSAEEESDYVGEFHEGLRSGQGPPGSDRKTSCACGIRTFGRGMLGWDVAAFPTGWWWSKGLLFLPSWPKTSRPRADRGQIPHTVMWN